MNLKKLILKMLGDGILNRRVCLLSRMRRNIRKQGSYYSRTFFYRDDKKLMYMSISKAGNTSIKASMFGVDERDDYRAVQRNIKNDYHGVNVSKLGEYEDYYKFTFVRNPFDRLVSCYENKLHSDKAYVGKTIKFLIYDAYLFGFLGKDKGFANFARRVCMIPDKYADRHFVSQSFRCVKDGKLILDYVGKFENFAQDYEQIRARYDLAPLPHYNQTKKEKKSWMDYYDTRTAKKVYKRYKDDIELFGYRQVYDDLLEYLRKNGK